jgi:hypothetical protein
MTDKTPVPTVPELHITQEQLNAIAGGECTTKEILGIFDDLKGAYESLIDLTSYVIERVAGP